MSAKRWRTNALWIAAAVGLGGVGGDALAAPPSAKTEAPSGSDELDVEIAYERYELDNGLEVILHQDRTAPLVAVNVWYHVGSGNETPGKSGFAHLFEHMMFQGAKHIGEDAHFETLKRIGGTGVNGTTNSDRTNYFETVPSHQIETALWLESDRMGYMIDLLNEKSLANQRDVVRNERRQRYDNVPYGRDRFAVAAALYPEGHPYRYLTIGRHEDLEVASIDDVRDFFLKWYVPSNATLTIAGDFETEDAKALVAKWFGTFPKLPEPESQTPDTPSLAGKIRTEIEDPFARLPRIHYVWHAPAAMAAGEKELDVAAGVLTSTGWGRLHKRLVLDEQLAQRVFAYHSGSGFSGAFHVVADLKPDADAAKAEKIIQEELDRITKEPVTPVELDRVRTGVEASFIWSLEDLSGRANRLQWFNHYTGDPGYAPKLLEEWRAVTPATVKKVAAKYLTKPRAEIITKPAPKQKATKSPTEAKAKKGGAK